MGNKNQVVSERNRGNYHVEVTDLYSPSFEINADIGVMVRGRVVEWQTLVRGKEGIDFCLLDRGVTTLLPTPT